MVDDVQDVAPEPDYNMRVGDTLRNARDAAGKSIEEVASETRVPLRHLTAIENSEYNSLPGKTYAMGFVRAYARTVGLDEAALVAKLRAELGSDDYRPGHQYEAYEPADPARVPPKTLVWTSLIVALLFAGGYGLWRSSAMDDTSNEVPTEEATAAAPSETATPAASAPVTPAVDSNAEVAIAAKDTVWFRIDDATGKRVHEAELKAGERYVVPAGQQGLVIRTSRPQAMDVSVAGQVVPQLGPSDLLVKDVSLNPVELAKRLAAPAASGTAPTAPVAGAAPQNGAQREIFPATTTVED